jgi:CarD family transcriptional regulator
VYAIRTLELEMVEGHMPADQKLSTKELTYKVGDAVVHPDQGAGMVTGIISLNMNGSSGQYYTINLINDQGTLMIPVLEADNIGLRSANYGRAKIFDVLAAEPVMLSDHHRSRHIDVENKIASGDPVHVAEVLRDLIHRERTDRLTGRDTKLKIEARRLLIGELAVRNEANLEEAKGMLDTLITQAMGNYPLEEAQDSE